MPIPAGMSPLMLPFTPSIHNFGEAFQLKSAVDIFSYSFSFLTMSEIMTLPSTKLFLKLPSNKPMWKHFHQSVSLLGKRLCLVHGRISLANEWVLKIIFINLWLKNIMKTWPWGGGSVGKVNVCCISMKTWVWIPRTYVKAGHKRSLQPLGLPKSRWVGMGYNRQILEAHWLISLDKSMCSEFSERSFFKM